VPLKRNRPRNMADYTADCFELFDMEGKGKIFPTTPTLGSLSSAANVWVCGWVHMTQCVYFRGGGASEDGWAAEHVAEFGGVCRTRVGMGWCLLSSSSIRCVCNPVAQMLE
jgi:hypothetical protein